MTEEERAAFALLDQAIEALFAISRGPDDDPNDVPIDAVLLLGVQCVDDDGARVGHVELFPRVGAQPGYITRGLVTEAVKVLDRAIDQAEDDER